MSRYQNGVLSNRAYAASVSSVAPGTAVGTAAAFCLYNPIGSGVYAVVWKVSMGYVSGTLGAGFIGLVANTNTGAAATTGTAESIVALFLGNPNGIGARVQALSTATLPATPTLVRPLWTLNAMLATTATQPQVEDIDLSGEIVIYPGATLSLEGVAAAGSTPLVSLGFAWAEHPLAGAATAHSPGRPTTHGAAS